jgi:hypothetical protein
MFNFALFVFHPRGFRDNKGAMLSVAKMIKLSLKVKTVLLNGYIPIQYAKTGNRQA